MDTINYATTVYSMNGRSRAVTEQKHNSHMQGGIRLLQGTVSYKYSSDSKPSEHAAAALLVCTAAYRHCCKAMHTLQ